MPLVQDLYMTSQVSLVEAPRGDAVRDCGADGSGEDFGDAESAGKRPSSKVLEERARRRLKERNDGRKWSGMLAGRVDRQRRPFQ